MVNVHNTHVQRYDTGLCTLHAPFPRRFDNVHFPFIVKRHEHCIDGEYLAWVVSSDLVQMADAIHVFTNTLIRSVNSVQLPRQCWRDLHILETHLTSVSSRTV